MEQKIEPVCRQEKLSRRWKSVKNETISAIWLKLAGVLTLGHSASRSEKCNFEGNLGGASVKWATRPFLGSPARISADLGLWQKHQVNRFMQMVVNILANLKTVGLGELQPENFMIFCCLSKTHPISPTNALRKCICKNTIRQLLERQSLHSTLITTWVGNWQTTQVAHAKQGHKCDCVQCCMPRWIIH